MLHLNTVEDTFVYFIQGEKTKLIKIGKTQNLIDNRFKQIQANSPDVLSFLGGCLESVYTESYLHKVFDEYRVHGEWFQPDKKILEFINNYCISNSDALLYVKIKVNLGEMTYDSALQYSISELLSLSDKYLIDIMNNMYKVDGKSIFDGLHT